MQGWWGQDWGVDQELLDLIKGLLSLRGPYKAVGFLQKPVKG
jgi:hypothetical protein